jgi:hypothetical protein
MIFSIDHLVFAASEEQRRILVARLTTFGFAPKGFLLDFPEIGAASESLGYSGGGMVEFVYGTQGKQLPPPWVDRLPRVIGIGFASNDFVADTEWGAQPGSWTMSEEHRLPDGSDVHIHAAGPHEHLSPFYVFVMDRPAGRLQFPELTTGPRLVRLEIAGRDAVAWRQRLQRWLHLRSADGQLVVGDVEIRFKASEAATLQVSPTFVVSDGAFSLPLSEGSLHLIVGS